MARSYTPTAMYRYGAMQKAGGAGSPSGVSYGPELIDDPGFDTPTDWDTPGAITGSQLVVTGLAATVNEVVPIVADTGKTYRVQLQPTVDAGVICNVTFGNSAIWTLGDGLGAVDTIINPASTAGFIVNPLASTAAFSSASIKEVL